MEEPGETSWDHFIHTNIIQNGQLFIKDFQGVRYISNCSTTSPITVRGLLAFLIKNRCTIKQRMNYFLRSLWVIQVSTSIPGTRFFLVTKIISVILAQRLKTKAHMLCLTRSVGHSPFHSSRLFFFLILVILRNNKYKYFQLAHQNESLVGLTYLNQQAQKIINRETHPFSIFSTPYPIIFSFVTLGKSFKFSGSQFSLLYKIRAWVYMTETISFSPDSL